MNQAPSPSPPLSLPPSARMLVDVEYLVEQLLQEAQVRETAAESVPLAIVAEPRVAVGGFGSHRRAMTFSHVRLSGLLRSRAAVDVVDALNAALADTSVDGVLLEVNTGGGEVTAASMIRQAIAGRTKPVVTYAHLAASGGMLATMDSDEIVAAGRTARVGSIGAMLSLPTWLRRMYGDYVTDLYATTSPDKNRAFKEWVQTGSTAAFVEELDQLDAIFMQEMRAARPITAALASTTLAGGTWLADEAKRRGLVDSIGTMNYALTRLASYAATTSSDQ